MEREAAKAKDAVAKKGIWVSKKISVEKKEALRTQAILQGSYVVEDLKNSADRLSWPPERETLLSQET